MDIFYVVVIQTWFAINITIENLPPFWQDYFLMTSFSGDEYARKILSKYSFRNICKSVLCINKYISRFFLDFRYYTMKTISRKKIDFVWLRAFDLFTLDISKLTASKILRQISVTLLTGLRKVAIFLVFFYVVIAVLSSKKSLFLTWICLLILLNVTETTWGTPNYLHIVLTWKMNLIGLL